MIDIKTYNYTGEPNRVNKLSMLAPAGDYNGVLNADFNVLRPVVRFRTKVPVAFNYAFIPSLNRWYFVDGITQEGDICKVSFSVDVLFTYKDEIRKLNALLVKGSDTDKFVSSRDTAYNTKTVNKFLWFPNSGILSDEGTITMTTLKGNK